jgi:hypothetical protein
MLHLVNADDVSTPRALTLTGLVLETRVFTLGVSWERDRGPRGARDCGGVAFRSRTSTDSKGGHMTADEASAFGPISYLIVEFPGNKMTGEGFAILLDLVDRGVIRILDLMFVTRDSDGSMRALELQDIDHDGQFDLAVFAGASSGLLGESDLSEAASVIEPGSAAGILVFENRWATPFIQALRRGKAELVSAGYIPQSDLVAALDAAEG